MCNPSTHTIHHCSQCGRDNGLDHCTSHCSEHIPQAVKVTNNELLEMVALLKRGALLSMLDTMQDSIVDALTDSGEDKTKAKEFVADLTAKYIQ